MKKLIAIFLVLALTFALAACGGGSAPAPAASGQPADPAASRQPADPAASGQPANPAASDQPSGTAASGRPAVGEKKACFITAYAKGNDFIDMIWDGFVQIEREGWSVRNVEALDASEYEEAIRAMAAEGYNLIMLFGAELINVGVDLSDEFKSNYPSLHFAMMDMDEDFQKDNITSVAVDPFESSFVAGYVAAMSTETGTVGVIVHSDVSVIRRFSDGYVAGVNYADNGTQTVMSVTGNPLDVSLAYEAALNMISTNPVDIIYQVCYVAGTGVITACAEKNIKAIGVDTWQGYIDDCVFWSALKPMDDAVVGMANMYANGEQFPGRIDFDISRGIQVYDIRDYEKLPAGLQEDVAKLVEGITNGDIDVNAYVTAY